METQQKINTSAKHSGTLHHEEPLLLDSTYDNLFKAIISAGWNNKSDGHNESTSGFFSLVEIPRLIKERRDMAEAVWEDEDDKELFRGLRFGWYITIENDQGFIFVYKMNSSTHATNAYVELEKAYALWCDADE